MGVVVEAVLEPEEVEEAKALVAEKLLVLPAETELLDGADENPDAELNVPRVWALTGKLQTITERPSAKNASRI